MRKYFLILINTFLVLDIYGDSKLNFKNKFYTGLEFSKNIEVNKDYINTVKGLFVNDTLFSFSQDNILYVFEGIVEYIHIFSTDSFKFTPKKAIALYTGSKVSFKFGLDELVSGVGIVWTPSDVLNPVYSLLYKKEEFYKPQYRSTFLSEMSLCLISEENVLLNTKLIYLPSVSQEIKTSKVAIAVNFNLLEYELFLIETSNVENLNKGSIGGYFRCSLPYIDFISPYAEIQLMSDDYNINKWLIGMQITPYFIKNTYFYLEHYKNSTGFKSYESFKDYQLQQYVYPVLGNTLINYLYAGFVTFNYSFNYSFGIIMCLDDHSGLSKMSLSKKLNTNSFIEISFYNLFYRNKLNEFYEILRKERELIIGLSIYFGT